jgi:hypothetical protein
MRGNMQPKMFVTLCTSLAMSVALVNSADAANWKEVLSAVNSSVNGPANNANQSLQTQQAASAAKAVQPGSLAELLMQRTGVTAAQAQGGAGALFQVAKNKMQPDAFAQLEQAVPGMNEMLGAVPTQTQPTGGLAGKLSSIAGASGGTAGNLVAVVSAFQQQGMSPAMVQQFVPVVVDYVRAHGNEALLNSLSAALVGR